PMRRKWVHLSPTKEIAVEVGQRRTSTPIILEVNAKNARKGGLKFFKATERVIICREIPPQYIKRG
ncbi:MAG: RNA 2'-phosphotransferase, partial [Candidatus Korarchaeota archaeon]|nr:RNA 2'-phosphotransferase [Candidatus Korarchaeota archaeon]